MGDGVLVREVSGIGVRVSWLEKCWGWGEGVLVREVFGVG